MITFDEAKKIALEKIGADCAIINEQIVEKPYGWYFNFQTKKYLKSKDISDMLVGSGGFVVEKEAGNVVRFGSAYSLEKNFEIYEKGFLSGNYDLIILKVKDVNQAVRMLNKLSMTYVKSELALGVKWKIPKKFIEKEIKNALSNLPHTFQNQNFYFSFGTFEEIDASEIFVYELRKYK